MARNKNLVVRGQIRKPDNKPAEGHLLRLHISPLQEKDRMREDIFLEPGGKFEYELDEPSEVNVIYLSARDGTVQPVRNGIPDLYWVDRVTVKDRPVNIGTKQLPEGRLLNVKVVDNDGNPVQGAGVRIATCEGNDCKSWSGSGRHSADGNGQFVHSQAEKPGMEMNGPTYTNVYHPDEEWEWGNHRDEAILNVEGPMEHVFEIEL